MSSKVTLDRAGRHSRPHGQGRRGHLRPSRGATPLQKERGVWVFRTGKVLTAGKAEGTLRNIRAQRHRQNIGESE